MSVHVADTGSTRSGGSGGDQPPGIWCQFRALGPDLAPQAISALFERYGTSSVSRGSGDVYGPKPYEFIGFGDVYGPQPYEFIGFGDIYGHV